VTLGVIVGLLAVVFWVSSKYIAENYAPNLLAFKSYPLRRIANCVDNESCVFQGQLRSVTKMTLAPLSERECAVYHIVIKRYYRIHRYKGIWKQVGKQNKQFDFVLQDGEHYAYVIGKGDTLSLHFDKKYTWGAFLRPAKHVMAYLDKYSTDKSNFLSNSIKLIEAILVEQDKVAVSGEGRWVDIEKYSSLSFLKEKDVSRIFEINQRSNNNLNISNQPQVLKYLSKKEYKG
ncbi:MAG: hypothetical protein MJK04_08890, partial [Psychrosphaera sp.]|nr:hypothetical protein [Psychrosphaera sp.]